MYTREHQDYFALQVLSQGLIEGGRLKGGLACIMY